MEQPEGVLNGQGLPGLTSCSRISALSHPSQQAVHGRHCLFGCSCTARLLASRSEPWSALDLVLSLAFLVFKGVNTLRQIVKQRRAAAGLGPVIGIVGFAGGAAVLFLVADTLINKFVA